MKRIQYHRYGGPAELHVEAFELPVPGKGEILVRVKAASLNPFDLRVLQGGMKFMTGNRFPRAMGTDFSGVVESVGAGVTSVRAGDEVFGTAPLKPAGTFAEKAITQAKLVIKKPASISHEQAAALPAVGATAWRGLVEKGQLKAGQKVFINGAYGGVGQAAVHIAKVLGASVTGRVGPNALADAKAIGVDEVLDYTQPIPASLNRQFDVVFDCHGGLTPAEGDALIKRGGVVVDTNPTGSKFFRVLYSPRRKFVMGNQSPAILQKIAELADSGKLSVSVGRTAKLDEAIAMISDFDAGKRPKGKAIIVME